MTRGGGGIGDDALNLKFGYDRVWFPQDAQGIILATGTSYGAGAPVEGELSDTASELGGIALDAADEVYFMLNPRKWDADWTRDIHALVGFTLVTGSQTGIIFTLDMKGVAAGVLLGDAKVTPDVSKAFPTLAAVAVSNALNETLWTPMNVPGVFVGDSVIACALTMTSIGTAAADAIKLSYIDFRYTVGLTDENGPFRT